MGVFPNWFLSRSEPDVNAIGYGMSPTRAALTKR